MNRSIKYLLYSLLLLTPAQLLAQVKKATAKKTTTSKPAVKPKPKTTAPKKIPAKTAPSVLVKTKVTPKKTVIKVKDAKLPVGVNTNENATPTLSSRELEMISEINILRKDPKAYIPYVEAYLKKRKGNEEVQTAGKELLKQLKTLHTLPELTMNPVMYSAAKQFGQSLKGMDEIEHSDLPYFENISLGHADIRDALLDLLVDDGQADRGHRKNLLNASISKVAVYEVPGEVQGYNNCYIQVFK